MGLCNEVIVATPIKYQEAQNTENNKCLLTFSGCHGSIGGQMVDCTMAATKTEKKIKGWAHEQEYCGDIVPPGEAVRKENRRGKKGETTSTQKWQPWENHRKDLA